MILKPFHSEMHFKELFAHEMMRPGMTHDDLDDVAAAFQKVWERKEHLKDL